MLTDMVNLYHTMHQSQPLPPPHERLHAEFTGAPWLVFLGGALMMKQPRQHWADNAHHFSVLFISGTARHDMTSVRQKKGLARKLKKDNKRRIFLPPSPPKHLLCPVTSPIVRYSSGTCECISRLLCPLLRSVSLV